MASRESGAQSNECRRTLDCHVPPPILAALFLTRLRFPRSRASAVALMQRRPMTAAVEVPRRTFLSRLALGAAAFGATASGASALPPLEAPSPDELDRWFSGMKGTYKAIYDCTGVAAAGNGVLFARNLLKFSAEKLGTRDADNSIVVCFRHFATPFAYTDAMWAKYPQMAVALQANDPKTKMPSTRNWLLHDLWSEQEGTDIPSVVSRGVVFAACGAATEFVSKLLAGPTGNAKQIEADLSANLIPNAKMVAAGVVALQRAQKAGFAYTYAEG